MSNAPWYGQQPPQQAPQQSGLVIGGKTLTALVTALVAVLGATGYHYWPTPQTPQAPLKKCGKCGSDDCGCQKVEAPRQAPVAAEQPPAGLPVYPRVGETRPSDDPQRPFVWMRDAEGNYNWVQKPKPEARADPFDPGNEAGRTTTYFPIGGGAETVVKDKGTGVRRVAYTEDSQRKWWANADADDGDQRPWYSTDRGQAWRREATTLTGLAPRTCLCPAAGNKDGSQGPNGCLCHQMDLVCACHQGAGTVFQAAPPPNPTPKAFVQPAARVMAPPRMVAARSAAACNS